MVWEVVLVNTDWCPICLYMQRKIKELVESARSEGMDSVPVSPLGRATVQYVHGELDMLHFELTCN